MQNQKLNSLLLVIIVILLAVVIFVVATNQDRDTSTTGYNQKQSAATAQNLGAPAPTVPSSQSTTQGQQSSIPWVSTTTAGLIISYDPNWTATAWSYGSPVQQAQGQSSLVGYRFTLPDGNTIAWGGPQNGCLPNAGAFQYGVSTTACVKNMQAQIQMASQSVQITQADKNAFGDFVQNNQ